MEQEKLKTIYEIVIDFWKLIKATIDITDNDEYWKRVEDLEDELYKKHNQHPLAYKLIWAYNDYLEEERKRLKNVKI